MKNQIILGMAILMSSFQMQAQQSAVDINPISASATQFETPVTDPKWDNISGDNFTKARYREFTGETSITLTASTPVEAQIVVDASVSKGILKVSMQGNDDIVFRKVFTADGKHTITAKLEPGIPYVVKFAGIRTKGAYYCQWTPTDVLITKL